MKSKILIASLIWATILTTWVASAYIWGYWLNNFNWLTTQEKTALETMTQSERQTFFQEKISENEEKRELHEKVLDKVLNWETLTAEEKTILEEIKSQRSEREKVRVIMEKRRNWETLTSEEKDILLNMQDRGWFSKRGWSWKRWWNCPMWGFGF